MQYQYHPQGLPTTAIITFIDDDEVALPTPYQSASFDVLNDDENSVQTGTLVGSELSEASHSITISAGNNTLMGNDTLGMRTIVMEVVDANGVSHSIVHRYFIEAKQAIKMGVNSMMSFSKALITRPKIPSLNGWDSALDDNQRKAALIEAYERLGRFRLSSSYEEKIITAYDESSLLALDSRALSDFQKAQMIEANALLGGEEHHDRRMQGIMSTSAGESTTFYRTRMALNRGISSKAYAYIVRYLDNTVAIGRT